MQAGDIITLRHPNGDRLGPRVLVEERGPGGTSWLNVTAIGVGKMKHQEPLQRLLNNGWVIETYDHAVNTITLTEEIVARHPDVARDFVARSFVELFQEILMRDGINLGAPVSFRILQRHHDYMRQHINIDLEMQYESPQGPSSFVDFGTKVHEQIEAYFAEPEPPVQRAIDPGKGV